MIFTKEVPPNSQRLASKEYIQDYEKDDIHFSFITITQLLFIHRMAKLWMGRRVFYDRRCSRWFIIRNTVSLGII